MHKPTDPQHPVSPPDPAESYERAKPHKASPQGTLDGPNPPVHETPDKHGPEGMTGRKANRPESDGSETGK
ncbi:hypothetical protein [Humisphaera borealis]|uniref:Uncharacterized protein n=1 Tax=Humisphaera borealis TaxID=2807512 RepID=A0A7M2WXR9_9BACT|nr:hypothetical protein [Humisphaera borealis]QOV89310.1 hypothetical protein IPV69_24395 [Humisphaera borealis]